MALPAIDLGLMAEHLSTHEGILNKLKYYQKEVTHPNLKEIIGLQIDVMYTHVKIMLLLINPNHNGYIEVPPISQIKHAYYFWDDSLRQGTLNNKSIAIEARATAKCMANENFVSALMMKNPNVRNAHIEMALQQAYIQERYSEFINVMGWAFVPHVSYQDQINTCQHFQHILNKGASRSI